MKRKPDDHSDMSLTDLATALCVLPLFCDLPIGVVYEIAEQAQAAAIDAAKSKAA